MNKTQYTCIVCVARDFLTIPVSEVDCERLFSEGRDLLGIRHYLINSTTMRMMMLLKGVLKSTEVVYTIEEPVQGVLKDRDFDYE